VNKIDILKPDELSEVLHFVSQNAAKIINGSTLVPVYGVSSRHALNSKLAILGGDPSVGPGARLWEQSQVRPQHTRSHEAFAIYTGFCFLPVRCVGEQAERAADARRPYLGQAQQCFGSDGQSSAQRDEARGGEDENKS